MRKGQTLVLLLAFMAISITVTAASVGLSISGTQASSRQELGAVAYSVAESGAENALMSLLRNPGYGGETLTVGSGVATITVTGVGNTYTITSTGRVGSFVRTLRIIAVFNGGVMSINSWQEIYP